MFPPLAALCVRVLARFPDQLHHAHARRIPATPALLDALPVTCDPWLWAALLQLVHPLAPDLHEYDLALAHPAVPLLQKIPHSPDFSLVTLVALPNFPLRDDDVASLGSLHRLVALDLRGCSISPYALTALARSLVAGVRSGPWGIRLLSLHGCPNISNDVLSVLPKFPLLSAIDLRFTRCTPAAVNTHLSPLGFRPSDNNTLFHPAPLSLALCSLEKVALTATPPISLYSCPPQSVFCLHIDKLDHTPSQTNKTLHIASASTSRSTIRTISSAEDTVVFIPPFRKSTKSDPSPPCESLVSSTNLSVASTSSPIGRSNQPDPVSNVSLFYQKAPVHSRKDVLPIAAKVVQSSKGGKLDSLAVARPPPPWTILDTCNTSVGTENSRRTQPIARWIGHTLNDPLKVDHARLHKRGSDAVTDMVHQFTSKRPKIESEFALAKTQAKVKSRNPFVRGTRSVFAESTCDKSRSPVHGSPREAEFAVQPRAASQSVRQQKTNVEIRSNKPLKPITSLKPPIPPKELLSPVPQYTPKPRSELKQTRLSFHREVE